MRMLLERVRRETPRFYLQAAIPPLNSYQGDELARLWKCQNELLTGGKLYWAALVQVNNALMMPSEFHLPGEVVCSPDPIFDAQPELLEEIASRIYDLKFTQPDDPELRVVADHITNEKHRAFCERIPTQLTVGRVVVRYTVLFYREHLPYRMLGPSRLLPLLVHGRYDTAMILPAPLWSSELKEEWKVNPEIVEALQRIQAEERAERRGGPVLRVTPAAVATFRDALAAQKKFKFVYVSLKGGDRSIGLSERKNPTDVEIMIDGLRFLVEAETAHKYWGLSIDYVHEGERQGLIVKE